MPRTKVAFIAALGLALFTPALSRTAVAGSYSYGFDQDKDVLHWAIVDEDRNSSSNLSELEDLDDLKAQYGSTFLYIRDGDERYVIKDRGMMQRVREAMKPITEAGREIGKAVGAKVSYSMRRSGYARERARMERQLARVERRLARLPDEGDDAEDQDQERQELENERQELQNQLDQLKDDRRERHASEEQQAELDAATERASRHMREATRNLDRQLRAILKEAKSRNIANRIGD